jgi:hypothetical protein
MIPLKEDRTGPRSGRRGLLFLRDARTDFDAMQEAWRKHSETAPNIQGWNRAGDATGKRQARGGDGLTVVRWFSMKVETH